jgi:DNA-binding response OmpR family regulator
MQQPISIFIAEDDQDDLVIFIDALKEIEPDVIIHSFNNGNTLMNELNSSQLNIPDLIFLDINMPYLTGIECLKRLRDNISFLKVPIIMLTTSGTREDIMESFYSGATRYITKPAEFMGLINVFEQLFSLYHSKRLNKTDLLNFTIKPLVHKGESTYSLSKQLLF